MMNKLFLIIISSAIFVIINSCQSTPGQGGNAQIKGTFWVRNYDPFYTYVVGRYPAINKTVYLFFGDDTSPGMSVNTNANGEFAFTYMRKGKYKVVAYSQQLATSSQPGQVPVETYVFIENKKDIKDIGLDTLNQ
jgi:hypothetical protein